jgi:hypothetical protein
LPADLWERQAHKTQLAKRCSEGDCGRGENRPAPAEQEADEPEEPAYDRGSADRSDRESGTGEIFPDAAPAHGGSEGLHH